MILQNGKDGIPADSKYTWVKYSQNPDGSNLTDDSTGAIYIGFAYNMESQEESDNPEDYTWIKFRGDDGEAGTDAYTVILGNENISFSVNYDSNAASSDQNYSSTIQVMQGATERTDFTIGTVSSSNGITVTKNDQNKTLVLSVQEGDVITADSGYFRIPINIDGLVFYKDLTWSLARQGQPGEQGDPGQAGEGAINVVVANESQTIACTNDGLVSESVLINIPFTAFKGFDKVPCSAVVGVLPSGITLGSNTASTADEDGLIILNVAAKSNLGGANILSGYVNITFTVERQTILKRFIWTKTKDGKDGNTYSLELSSIIVNKNYDGTLSPQSITLNAYYQNGSERVPYEGRFIIAESYFDDVYFTDENNNLLVDENNNLLFLSGSNSSLYTNVYMSTENESEHTHSLTSASLSGIICYLCSSDSITNILDQQTVTILSYIDDIKPIITEITNTISGVSQKVDAVEQSITNQVWQKDITDAINNYDGTTVKTIRDQMAEQTIAMGEITSKVSDIESEITTLPDGTVIQELTEKVSELEQNAEGFKQTVEENYVTNDDLSENSQTLRSEFAQTAENISQTVTNLRGDVSTITQDVSSINQRVEDSENNISSLQQTSESLSTQIQNNANDIASFELTAGNLQTQINNNAGNISQLQQDAEGFKTTVSNTYVSKENAITNTKILYYLSNSTTTLSGGSWMAVAPEWTQGKYMWSKSQTEYADGNIVESDPVCIAGAQGQSGKGILSTTITYQVSSSGTSVPGGQWGNTIPTVPSGQYLWTKTQITYTDQSNTVSYSVSKSGSDGKDGTGVTILGSYNSEEELKQNHPSGNLGDGYIVSGNLYVWNGQEWQNVGNIQGPPGTPGKDGTGIFSTEIEYQVSMSGTTPPSGAWQSSIPELQDDQFLWTRTTITYTDKTSSVSYSVSKNGSTGEDGTSIVSITPEYYLSTSKESPLSGEWSSIPPTWSSGMYIWTRSKIVYKNPTSTEYTDPICDSSWEAVNDIEIGGRNLQRGSSDWSDSAFYNRGNAIISNNELSVPVAASTTENNVETHYIGIKQNDIYTISVDIKGESNYTGNTFLVELFNALEERVSYQWVEADVTTSWSRISYTITITESTAVYMRIGLRSSNNVVNSYRLLKIEKGNKATDWTPAPEDVDEGIQNAQETADEANFTASSNDSRLTVTESEIQQLAESISMLVTDGDGNSMMTQTSEGWRFDISTITNTLNDAKNQLNDLSGSMAEANSTIQNVKDLANDLAEKTAYIVMTTDDSGNPCIELGKSDNDFKLRITNESIDFMDGSSRIAYVSNQMLYITKAVIKDELQIGEGNGYVWKKRSSGNMGLRYVG